eukprot:GFUD01036104.1.p1 GENE.GFUD01036104.1~~GFUD01036104.1.p1  ORF type:complete len:227 (-),score=59.28 GFUD01036104.1:14-694(-)
MEPEHLREGVTIPNMNASFLYPEEPRHHCLKSPTPAPPPILDMMETILEFGEAEDESPARCSSSTPGKNQSHHLHLSSPMENSSLQFQSPVPNTPLLSSPPWTTATPFLQSTHPPLDMAKLLSCTVSITCWSLRQLPSLHLSLALPSSCLLQVIRACSSSVTVWPDWVEISRCRTLRSCSGLLQLSFSFVGGGRGTWSGSSGWSTVGRDCRKVEQKIVFSNIQCTQ